MGKLGTTVFALFSVAVAVAVPTHVCLSPFLLPYVAVFKVISLQCRNLAQQGVKKVAKTSVS